MKRKIQMTAVIAVLVATGGAVVVASPSNTSQPTAHVKQATSAAVEQPANSAAATPNVQAPVQTAATATELNPPEPASEPVDTTTLQYQSDVDNTSGPNPQSMSNTQSAQFTLNGPGN